MMIEERKQKTTYVMDLKSCIFRRESSPWYLISGEFPYYRINPELWYRLLEKIRGTGIEVLSFYIPWRHHMPSPGTVDFSGESGCESRNLKLFLEMLDSLNFSFIAKVGPFICAEYRRGGIPDWLLEIHPEVVMRDCDGYEVRFFEDGLTLPDPLHPVTLEYVKMWYREVVALLQPFEKQGRLVAVQIDNEFPFSSMHFADPFTWGYNEPHLTKWQEFIAERKGTNGDLPPMYKRILTSKEDWIIYMDWMKYKETVATEIIKVYSEYIREAGLNVPLYHDLIMLENESPVNYRCIAENVIVCPNFWFEKHPAYSEKEYVRAIVRSKLARDVKKQIMYASETNWSWGNDEEFLFQTLILLPYFAGLNIYCLADGKEAGFVNSSPLSNVPEPYPGCAPLDDEGKPRKAYFLLNKLTDFLGKEDGRCGAELAQASEYSRVAICNLMSYGYPHTLSSRSGVKLENLFPILPDMNSWLWGLATLLIRNNISFDIVDVETASKAKLQDYLVVFAPSFKYMDGFIQSKLIDYVGSGGTLFLFPDVPLFDSAFQNSFELRNLLFGEADYKPVTCYVNVMWPGFGELGTLLSTVNLVEIKKLEEFNYVETAFTQWDDFAIGLSKEYGSGKIYWLGCQLYDLPYASNFVEWFLKEKGVESEVEIKSLEGTYIRGGVHARTLRKNNSAFAFILNRSEYLFHGEVKIDEPPCSTAVFKISLPPRKGIILWYNSKNLNSILGEEFLEDFYISGSVT